MSWFLAAKLLKRLYNRLAFQEASHQSCLSRIEDSWVTVFSRSLNINLFKVLTSDLFSKSFDFTTHPAPLKIFLEIWQWLLMGEAGTWKHIRMMWWWWQNDLRLTNNWSRSMVNFQMFVWFSLCFWVTPCSFKLLWTLTTRWLPCTHLQLLPQDPILCWPYRYLQCLGPIPCEPRKLNPVKAAKKSDYLALAKLLLQRAPSMSTGRSVEFLVPLLQFGSMHFIMTFDLTKMFIGYLIVFFSAFWISIRVWGPYKSHSIPFQFHFEFVRYLSGCVTTIMGSLKRLDGPGETLWWWSSPAWRPQIGVAGGGFLA